MLFFCALNMMLVKSINLKYLDPETKEVVSAFVVKQKNINKYILELLTKIDDEKNSKIFFSDSSMSLKSGKEIKIFDLLTKTDYNQILGHIIIKYFKPKYLFSFNERLSQLCSIYSNNNVSNRQTVLFKKIIENLYKLTRSTLDYKKERKSF